MIYLASPYSYNNGPVSLQSQIIQARYKLVEFQTALYFKTNRPVLSPIVHNHELALHYNLPGSFDYWQKMNKAWISCCHEFHVLDLPGWEKSVGVQAEAEFAETIGMWTTHIDWQDFKLIIEHGPLKSTLYKLIPLLEDAEY